MVCPGAKLENLENRRCRRTEHDDQTATPRTGGTQHMGMEALREEHDLWSACANLAAIVFTAVIGGLSISAAA